MSRLPADRPVHNPFAQLGLQPAATVEQVKQAWRRLASQHHPDKGGDAQTFHQLRRAYNAALAEAVKPKTCIPCGGRGRVARRYGFNTLVIVCDACNGSGSA